MLFLTFIFPHHVVNTQKYIIITLTNARAIHSHSPCIIIAGQANDVTANSTIPDY